MKIKVCFQVQVFKNSQICKKNHFLTLKSSNIKFVSLQFRSTCPMKNN